MGSQERSWWHGGRIWTERYVEHLANDLLVNSHVNSGSRLSSYRHRISHSGRVGCQDLCIMDRI